jgi:oxygen-independent coproporphyrinogen-3 oxidase
MWTYYPDLLAKPVPRYTSYPTAAEFHDGVGESDQRAGLAQIRPDEPISLYIHIPYCREICWYCGCNTGAANRAQRLSGYLDKLSREIDIVAEALDGRGRVARIAFGGGSPNAIAPEQFSAVVDRLESAFSWQASPTVSVEIDPRGFNAEFAAALADAKVTRASLGVQTFSEVVQGAIGRIQPPETIERAVELLRGAGISSLNFDLMYGLPRQDEEILLESLELSHEMGADRLAVFGYAHVPHMVPRQRRIDATALPGAAERFGHAALAHEWLTGKGWVPVGFDHFARVHDPLAVAVREQRVRRNFQGFTDDGCDTLIGLGASAISRFAGSLVQNERNSGRYGIMVGNAHLAGVRGIALSEMEVKRSHLIEQLLCQGLAQLEHLPDRMRIRDDLLAFEDRKLLNWNRWELRLAPEASPYARSIAAVLDPWRAESSTCFSTAV